MCGPIKSTEQNQFARLSGVYEVIIAHVAVCLHSIFSFAIQTTAYEYFDGGAVTGLVTYVGRWSPYGVRDIEIVAETSL